jgi:subtilisin family serine protease
MPSPSPSAPSDPAAPGPPNTPFTERPDYITGRTLVAYPLGAFHSGLYELTSGSDLKLGNIASYGDFSDSMGFSNILDQSDAVRIDELGTLVVKNPAQLAGFSAAAVGSGPMPMMSPERWVFPAVEGLSAAQVAELAGRLLELQALIDRVLGRDGQSVVGAGPAGSFADTAQVTWGLKAIGGDAAVLSGDGVSVAIIDTGIDTQHPDFKDRPKGLVTHSFVNETVDDVIGHGTHVAGSACGPRATNATSYGVAPGARLCVAKVFPHTGPNANRASDGDVLAAVAWALRQKCQVANLSLSGPAAPGMAYSAAFEVAANNALRQGLLLVAAAGNDSALRDAGNQATGRMDPPMPVGHPANCPSVLAIGALTRTLAVALFSNGGQSNPANGVINLAAPGDAVVSSWPRLMPIPGTRTGMNILSGTSMAAPHVTGLAALYSQSIGGLGGQPLWQALNRGRIRALVGIPARDVGRGLLLA